jgi:hypothetical protein
MKRPFKIHKFAVIEKASEVNQGGKTLGNYDYSYDVEIIATPAATKEEVIALLRADLPEFRCEVLCPGKFRLEWNEVKYLNSRDNKDMLHKWAAEDILFLKVAYFYSDMVEV